MALKRYIVPQSRPCTKVKYKRKQDAIDACFYKTKNGKILPRNTYIYWCKYCRHWHLTTHPWLGAAPSKREEIRQMYEHIASGDLPELNKDIAP